MTAVTFVFFGRIAPGGIYVVSYRSVLSSKVPARPGTLRTWILPSGYFIHPANNGRSSFLSSCVQLNLKDYLSHGVRINDNLRIMFLYRTVAILKTVKGRLASSWNAKMAINVTTTATTFGNGATIPTTASTCSTTATPFSLGSPDPMQENPFEQALEAHDIATALPDAKMRVRLLRPNCAVQPFYKNDRVLTFLLPV